MSIATDSNIGLACLAELAGQSFDSFATASALILPAMTTYLHCRSSLVARVDADEDQITISAVYQLIDDDALVPGSVIAPAPAERAFWWGARAADEVTRITTPRDVYAVGTPIRLEDGTGWGLLIGLDVAPLAWTPTHAHMMSVLARRLAAEVACQQQREHVTALKGDFVSIVSHEFRTALMSILGFSQMLRDEACSPAEVHEFAADIYGDATRISRMITDMLDLDRMESGRMKLTLADVDLNHILRDIATRFAATTANHTLRLQIDPTLPHVAADTDKVIQMITNLLSNAIKYSPQGGEIVLGSASDGGMAHLWVRDQGMGVPPDALERIFERYSRVEAQTSRYIQGTGLGLPIVRQLAQMHGGQAWAESRLGHGATFHVTLPPGARAG